MDERAAAEAEAVRARYERRTGDQRHNIFAPDVILRGQAQERGLISLFQQVGALPLDAKSVLELGCGDGIILLNLIRLGFDPAKLTGLDLREDAVVAARRILPASVRVIAGDASAADLGGPFDIVHQSTMFSSILDPAVQDSIARRMWALTKPGGAVLWYDLAYDNPRNPDVKGVSLPRIRALFPEGQMIARPITLAPPLARLVAGIHPSLYAILDAIPLLRSHLLCWIRKP